MTGKYLQVLAESLMQKQAVLEEIEEFNKKQEESLKGHSVSLEEFDDAAEAKEKLIQKIVRLDAGFETLFEKVQAELLAGREHYKEQIENLQKLVTQVTEKSIEIQAQEARNKRLVEQYFVEQKSQLKNERKSSKAAYGYYKGMSNSNVVMPQFMDQKK